MKTRILPNLPSMLIVLNTVAFKTTSVTLSSKPSGSSRLTASHIELFSLCFSTSHHFYCMHLEMSHICAILEWPEHSWGMYTTILQRKHTADYEVILQMIHDFMSLQEGRSRNLTWNIGWSYISILSITKPFITYPYTSKSEIQSHIPVTATHLTQKRNSPYSLPPCTAMFPQFFILHFPASMSAISLFASTSPLCPCLLV